MNRQSMRAIATGPAKAGAARRNSAPAFHGIFVLLPLHAGYFRDALVGISKFRLANPHWRMIIGELPDDPRHLRASTAGAAGVIAGLLGEAWERAAARLPCPVVNISGFCQRSYVPRLTLDNVQVGRLGAEHLVSQGFRRLAFAYKHGYHAIQRREGFEAVARERGCEILRLESGPPTSSIPRLATHWWRPDLLARFDLPAPIGIMAEGDRSAGQLLETCHTFGLAVPQQVAIIGVYNDTLYCETLHPRLSSIDVNAQRIGFEAAQLLERLLGGARMPTEPVLIPPKGVVVRESTNTVAVDDPDLACAVRYIHDHACGRISVDDIASQAAMCRRTLERRFLRHFGHTLYAEIQRVRFDRAKRLLAETDLKVPQVASRCGFNYYPHFIEAFGRAIGRTPSAYRRQFRLDVRHG